MWESKGRTLTANTLLGKKNNPAGRELSPFSLSIDKFTFRYPESHPSITFVIKIIGSLRKPFKN